MTELKSRRHPVVTSVMLIVIQLFSAVFFAADAAEDWTSSGDSGVPLETWLESILSALLLVAVLLVARQLHHALAQVNRQNAQITVSRGAMAELLATRFGEWRLSKAECDVALFALKGYPIGEIASLRASAEGTVRSQLSQIYAKAGVTSQTMLLALFFEDLL